MRVRAGALTLAVLTLAACGEKAPTLAGEPAEATPQALVAVALSHLTPEPDAIEFYDKDDEVDDRGTTSPWIGGQLSWDPDPDWSLSLRVQPAPADYDGCSEDVTHTCTERGGATLTWQASSEDNPGYLTVSVVEDDELRSVGYEGGGIDAAAAGNDDLPVDLDELVAIVTDPAFALETTSGAVEAGKDVAKQAVRLRAEERRKEKERREASPPGTTPRSLAAYVMDRLTDMDERLVATSGREQTFPEPGREVLDGWGIELTLEDDVKLHVTVIGAMGSYYNTCLRTLTCWTERGRVLLGRDGLAGMFHQRRDGSVHVWVEGAGVRPTGPRYFDTLPTKDRAQGVVQAALVLVDDTSIGSTTTDEWIEAGEELDWWKD